MEAESSLNTTIARDLRLNLERLLSEGALGEEDGHLAFLASSVATDSPSLIRQAEEFLASKGISPDLILEAKQSAAIMAMLNTYYRFRHFVGEAGYERAGLRMTALAKPLLGKERFEKLAFAISVINGCETCVKAHEKVLKDAGVTSDAIHDLARIASVTRGLSVLEKLARQDQSGG